MRPDQEMIDRWSGSAPFWEKHRENIRQMFAPVTEALIEDAAIRRGHAVLDIATGQGEPALSVAKLVAPDGKVVGVDLAPEMVAAARREADRQSLSNARFEAALADELPFPDDTFDAVISRFGVMFFPSPVGALREMLRVLKPGGKLALAVWGPAERNDFFCLSKILERYIDSPPPAPDAPDAFRFANPEKLREIFIAAGVANPEQRVLPFAIEAAVSVEDFWTLRCEMSEKMRLDVAALSTDQSAALKLEALAALRKYSTGPGMSFPAEVSIVSGTKRR